MIGSKLKRVSKYKKTSENRADAQFEAYSKLSFKEIEKIAHEFAKHIKTHRSELVDILLMYESYEVADDEILRTLDLFKSLAENRGYFKLRVGDVTSFLPRNQPLYALSCFILVPSLMARGVHFRIPQSMRHFFPELLSLLRVQELFPNVKVSEKRRLDFLRERSALCVNPHTKQHFPKTDVVIFTGTSAHAEQLRILFDNRTLFIANGAGHNPIVVGPNASIEAACDAILKLGLYNQGQDCAAPNAILVHHTIAPSLLSLLRNKLSKVRVGPYREHRDNRVGPISNPEDLVRIQQLMVDNSKWLDSTTPGVIRTREVIAEPTLVVKPLSEGGNFNEVFAPIIFFQEYKDDGELHNYFENPHYARNAMYISLYGTSHYIDSLIDRRLNNKILHDRRSILWNTHLHVPGIERGTEPYGGLGLGASSVSIAGTVTGKATLPQRDIYEYLCKPLLKGQVSHQYQKERRSCSVIEEKNVDKLLRLHTQVPSINSHDNAASFYLDSRRLNKAGRAFIEVQRDNMYVLLSHPNIEYIATLAPSELRDIRALRTLLMKRRSVSAISGLKEELYKIASGGEYGQQKTAHQLRFFKSLYQLLFNMPSGPHLPQFLIDADRQKICALLNV